MKERELAYDFGLRLKKLRDAKGLSQKELAQKLGVSKGTVYGYENNTQSPSLENAAKLALLLDTSLDYLAGLENALTIQLPDLNEEERNALMEFIRIFVQKK